MVVFFVSRHQRIQLNQKMKEKIGKNGTSWSGSKLFILTLLHYWDLYKFVGIKFWRLSIIFLFPVTRPTVPFFQKTRTFSSQAVGKIVGNQITGIHFFAGIYVILTHGLSKMTSTNELYAFSTDFFTFTSTKSCELARGRLSSRIWGVNRVNKKIRKKHFSRLFLLPTNRPNFSS